MLGKSSVGQSHPKSLSQDAQESIGKKSMTVLFLVSSVMMLICGVGIWILTSYRGNIIQRQIQERLIAESKLTTHLARAEDLAALTAPEDVNKPIYGQIKARLTEFVKENHVSRAYFARETKDGLLQYIVDSEPNPKLSENIATPPRQERDSAAVIRRALSGEVVSQDINMYVEGAEGMVSGFAPIYAANGEVVAIAGVDISDVNIVFMERFIFVIRTMILISGAISTLAGFMNLHMYRRSALNAEAANASKSDFLSRMSHEMRTPLNAIIGLSLLTREFKGIQDEPRENVQKIHEAGVTLLHIINDILDISKIKAGKFELNPVEYEIPSMINDTVSLNIMRLRDKPVRFRLHVPADLPARLYGDDLRVKQIFNNLLSNAFKYTDSGTVDWTLNWEREEQFIWLTSEIKDTGKGIRKEDLEKLFKDYGQVDSKANRKIAGTGLGLAIAYSMAYAMNGSVEVESVYGTGSKFTLRIRQGFVSDVPIGEKIAESLNTLRYQTDKQASNSRLVRIQLPNARVLIVDDVPTNLDVAKGMMKPYRMQIDCVTSGRQAVDLVRKGEVRYNAIFMDHMMPEMDGMEATRIIREEIGTEYAKNVHIIALTANAIRGNDVMFLNHGFNAFLAKPIDVMQLDAVIRRWVREKGEEKEAAGQEAVVLDGNPSVPETGGKSETGHRIEGLDFGKGVERFGDEAAYFEILASFSRNTPPLLEKARGVRESALGDYAIVVHGIKGASYGICAQRLGDLAEEMEHKAKAGDFAYVEEHNGAFLQAAETLIEDINTLLKTREASA